MSNTLPIIIGITGASGSVLAKKTIDTLLESS
ncbi:MAG TPA: aromatic acid decarboxylase, partial [Dehalococcoidia bacterium]|nr:aromatic acid decarboxylase [Dehalococcoidia bacterium]